MIGLILIATGGERYTQFLQPLADSMDRFMPPHHKIIFHDANASTRFFAPSPESVTMIYQPDLGWPRATLMRYHAMLKAESVLRRYSHVFYMDVDMLVESPIHEKDICSAGLTAVIHNGYPDAFCRDPKSTAYVPESAHPVYYQGCFIGGETNRFIGMCEATSAAIDEDDRRGVTAIWHDESHLNKFLISNPPEISLTPAYAFPELHYLRHTERWLTVPLDKFVPKIRHLEKPGQDKWKIR